MKSLKLALALAGVLTLSTTVLASETETETFFKGFENGCQGSAAFDNYVESICKYTTNKKTGSECKVGTVKLPASMPVENVTAENKDDHSLIKLTFKPDTVMWRGLNVVRIETWHGHDNGIRGQALIVKSNSDREAKKIAIKNGAKFKKLNNDAIGPVGSEFIFQDNVVHVVCDVSN